MPVTLELGSKASVQNGNGHNGNGHHENGHDSAPQNGNVMRVNGNNAKAQGSVDSFDNSAYDKIRQANTTEEVVEEDFGSGSASCGIPTKDYNVKAYSNDGEAILGADDEEEPSTQFIKLGNFTVPRKDKTEEKTPVEAD